MSKGRKKMRDRWRALLLFLILCLLSVLSGCDGESAGERGQDWDYTVVPTADCPEDFLKEIEQKKINAFQMTYDDGAYCYLAVGYGEQETDGYSIRVLGLYEQGEELCLETSLVGPEEDTIVRDQKSTPYLVIKTKKTDKKINFL